MFRTSILRAARTLAIPRVAAPVPALRVLARPAIAQKPAITIAAVRAYSDASGLSKVEVESRIIDLLKGFDKIPDPSKITGEANFAADLGLDSLDTVEVVMAIEEEFNIEIPDKEADAILSIKQAVDYVVAQPDAH